MMEDRKQNECLPNRQAVTCSLARHATDYQVGMMPRVRYFDRELDAHATLSFDMYTPKYRAGATTL